MRPRSAARESSWWRRAKFLSEFTGAVKNRTGAAFRARYRDLDVLLVDDVHNLAGKKATQAEFFQTVAALHDLGRLVVLAGDQQAIAGASGARFHRSCTGVWWRASKSPVRKTASVS